MKWQNFPMYILYASNLAETNPCTHMTCTLNQDCLVNRHGEAVCVCPFVCPLPIEPVCGTDGLTYDSSCHLKREACNKSLQTTVLHAGPCRGRFEDDGALDCTVKMCLLCLVIL